MRYTAAAPFALLALTGCSELAGPVAADLGSHSIALQAATVSKGVGVFQFDAVVPFDCVDENVHATTHAPYTFHVVTTPTGEYVYHDHWDPQSVTGTLVGQSTGTIWNRERHRSPYIERSTGGGMQHYTFTGIFVSETGPTLKVRELYHVSRDAAGEIRVQRHEFTCTLQPGTSNADRAGR